MTAHSSFLTFLDSTADALDYNLNFDRNELYFDGTTPWRSSDHDPVIVGVDLDAAGRR